MRYQGREIDVIELWSNYVEFPANVKLDGEFLPKVICPNPEHDTFKKHFQINAEKGLVHCFAGCGISGTYERAIAIIEGITEGKARKRILEQARSVRIGKPSRGNVYRPRNESAAPNERRQNLHYQQNIPPAGREFLAKRGVGESAIAHFEIGWDKEDLRIVIPAKDTQGKTKLLIKRGVKDSQRPKYLYTEGFPKTSLLFGACDLNPGMVRSQGIVVVEGSFDRIVLWQYGIRNVVATLGTGISEVQARILENFRPSVVKLLLDRDTSGIHGIEIARRRIKSPIYVCKYPKLKFDPAELTREEAYRSLERAIPVAKLFNPNAA